MNKSHEVLVCTSKKNLRLFRMSLNAVLDALAVRLQPGQAAQ